MPGNFIESLLSYGRETFGIPNATANDAAAQSQRRDPPERPSAQGTAPPSASAPPVIDLLSPSKPLTSSMRHKFPPNTHSEPRSQSRRSADEQRLLPDFSTPADAVAAPDPLSYMPGTNSGHGIMYKKPSSNAGFRPINTIDDINPRFGHGRPKTYAKHNRPYQAPIGKAQHAGQRAYMAKQAISPTTPARNQSFRTERARTSGGASAGKRQKLDHVIDLSSDQDSVSEEREVLSPSAPPTSAGTSHKMPPSTASPHSHFSNESTSAINVSKGGSQPESAFQLVDTLTNTRRKKARKPGSDRNQGTRRMSPFGGGDISASAPTHKQTATIDIFDDNLPGKAKAPRQHILQELIQGSQGSTSHSAPEYTQSSHKHGTTTSPHFPNLRINESTSERPAATRQSAGDSTELRKKFRQAPRKSTDNDGSEDELAISDADRTPRKLIKSPSKATQAANGTVRGNVQTKSLRKATRGDWPLLFARTHGHERLCPEMKNGRHGLVLHVDGEGWRVREWNQTDAFHETKFEIKPQDFIKVQADDVGRIRLEGPRKQDGNCRIVDLRFVNRSDYLQFRDEYAKKIPPTGKILVKDAVAMEKVFSKALVLNDKVGTSKLVEDSIFEADSHHEQAQRVSDTPLLDFLTPNRGGSKIAATAAEKWRPVAENLSSRVSNRPARSTRSSVPNCNQETNADEKPVTKFSIDVGLGTPWIRPLEYARGRQRAVVHFDDLPRLDEEECLNDSLIDFYMIYLCDKLNVPSDKVYFFNTYFFTQLTKNTGRQSMNYKAVERWTSKIDVFSYDYIVVPINEATHWYLAIICNVSNIARKPLIEDFDRDLAEALEQSRKDIVKQRDTRENGVVVEDPPQTLQPQNSVDSTVADTNEPNDEDTNLFDEESKLNLIDRNDMGNEGQVEAASSQTLPMPLPQLVQSTQVQQDVLDAEVVPEGILSKLTMSPERKKTKRKHAFPRKDPTQPIILILDSLSQTRSGTVRALKDWLAAEGEAKRGMEVIIKEKGYYPKASQIPMQNNWTDCGVYLLGYVEKFFQNPDQFKNKLLTGEMSATEDWPELKPVEMRHSLRKIIFKLAEDQKVARKAEKKLKNGLAKDKAPLSDAKDEPTNPEPKVSQSVQIPAEVPGDHIMIMDTDSQITQPEQHDSEATTPVVPKPRLASPFSPKLHSVQQTAQEHNTEGERGVSGLPHPKAGLTSPGIQQAKRRKSPEVRIAVTPPTAGFARNGVTRSTGAAHKGEYAPRTQDTSTSMSPSKRRRVNEDQDMLRMPPVKKPFVQSSPITQRCRGANASQPITIEDSQEDKSPATLVSTQQIGLPAQRRPPTRSSPARRALQSYPSIEEIPGRTSKVTDRAHGQLKDHFPGRELEAKLKEADEERNKPRSLRVGSSPSAPIYLERRKETFERMDIDIHDRDERAMSRSPQDFEIPETPEPESRGCA